MILSIEENISYYYALRIPLICLILFFGHFKVGPVEHYITLYGLDLNLEIKTSFGLLNYWENSFNFSNGISQVGVVVVGLCLIEEKWVLQKPVEVASLCHQ